MPFCGCHVELVTEPSNNDKGVDAVDIIKKDDNLDSNPNTANDAVIEDVVIDLPSPGDDDSFLTTLPLSLSNNDTNDEEEVASSSVVNTTSSGSPNIRMNVDRTLRRVRHESLRRRGHSSTCRNKMYST